jgi:uncharacterized protein
LVLTQRRLATTVSAVESFWRRAGVQLGKFWYVVAVVFLLITALLALGLRQLEFATGQDSYLNQDSQVAIDNVEFQDSFGGEAIIIMFQAEDGADITDLFAGDNLEELERMGEELRAIPEVYAVVAPLESLTFSEALVQEGVGTNAILSASAREPDPDAAEIRANDISTTLTRLGEAGTQEFTNPDWVEFLIFDNTGFELTDGAVVAPDDEDRSVRGSLVPTFPNLDTAVGGVLLQGNADLDTLSAGTDAVVGVLDTVELEGFEVVTTGSPIFLAEINDYLQGGMLTLGAAALAVMAVLLLLMFRVRWRLLPLLSVVVGVVWAFAVLGLINVDLSLVTISGLPILIGLGIDFAIQIQNRVEEEVVLDKATHPMSETLSNLSPALIVATVAGVVAFLALLVSQVPMIRDFGVMLAVGIVALVIVGIVLPTAVLGIREWTARTAERKPSFVERLVVKLGSLPSASAVPLLIASVILFVSGVAFEGQMRIESDPLRWIDQDSPAVADLERLSDVTGFESTLGILVESNNVLADPIAEVVNEFTLQAEAREDVVSTSSLVNTIAKIIAVPGATPLAPTSADLQAAAEVAPPDIERVLLSPDRTATQINLRLARSSLEERAVLVEQLEADLDGLIAELDLPQDSVLLVDLDGGQPPVRAVPSGLAVVGVGLLENLSANRAILTYLGLALVALWLLIRFRSLPRALLTMVPIGLAVGTSSVVVGATGITLSPLTTVSGPLVIATCTEFSVLITARYLEERQRGLGDREASTQAARRTGRAFFTSAATTVGGFAVLIGSALPLLRDFGVIVTLNVTVALLAALVVLPPVLVWADRRGFLDSGDLAPEQSVVLAAKPRGSQMVAWVAASVVVFAVATGLFLSADRQAAVEDTYTYEPVSLPEDDDGAEEAGPAPGGSPDGVDGGGD